MTMNCGIFENIMILSFLVTSITAKIVVLASSFFVVRDFNLDFNFSMLHTTQTEKIFVLSRTNLNLVLRHNLYSCNGFMGGKM